MPAQIIIANYCGSPGNNVFAYNTRHHIYTYQTIEHLIIATMAQAGIDGIASDKKEVVYHRTLCRLMAFMGGYEPNYHRVYAEAELLEIKPKDVARFMKQLIEAQFGSLRLHLQRQLDSMNRNIRRLQTHSSLVAMNPNASK